MSALKGAMGMYYSEVGEIAQAMARALVDRGFDEDELRERLERWGDAGREARWWEMYGGRALDELAYDLNYDTAYPEGT